MGGAAGFIWVMVVILALAWALVQTGTVNLGVDFNLWVNVLLGLAVLGLIFNLFILPFLGRKTTSTTSASASGTAAPAAPPAAPAAPAATTADPNVPATSAGQREVVQETKDRPSF
jgi:hypothetical protein